jgi:autotransporter-associated beta strand protein
LEVWIMVIKNRTNTLSALFTTKRLLAASLALALVAVPANGQVIADFNDLAAGNLWPQSGGTGYNTGWGNLSSTGVVKVVAGDLYGPAGTAYGIFQSGTSLSVQSVHGSASRRVGRGIDPLALPSNSDDIWFSFLANSETASRWAGIDFNNAGSSSAMVVDERVMLRGTDLYIGGATGATIDVSSKYTLGDTGLIVGRLVTGGVGDAETLDIWFNPDLSGGEVGLLGITPEFTSSDMEWDFSGITRIGLQSYVDGGTGGIIDNVRLSNSVTAFVDVVGNPLLNAEWDVDASGNWGNVANWTTISPTGGLEVILGSAITSSRTVTMDVDAAAGQITFDNAGASYNVALGAGNLELTNGATAVSGSHSISTGFLASNNGENTFNADLGATLNLTGTATANDSGTATFVLDGAGDGNIGAIRDNNNLANPLDGTDNVSVVKRGTGTWTIGTGTTVGEDFHGGNTTVEAGTLKVKSNAPGGTTGELRSPVISVNAGATFDTSEFSTYSLGVDQSLGGAGTVDTGAGTLQVYSDNVVTPGDSVGTLTIDGDLTLNAFEGSSPTGGFEFELSPSALSGNDQVVVTGDITSNAGGGGNQTGIILSPTGTTLGNGSYELFTFGGSHTGSASDYTLSGIETRYSLGISVDSDSVNLDVSGSNANLVWRGNNGGNPTNWDINTTSNWDNSGLDVYFDLDNVTFDDTAVGTTVNLQGTLTPASVTFNNISKDITINGPGAIAGSTDVNKAGTGRVTIVSPNTYSGVTNITAGVLHAGHGSALGDTTGVTVVNGGALDITHINIAGEVVHIQGAGSDGRGALMTDGTDAIGGGGQQMSAVVQDGDATIAAYYDGVDDSFEENDYRWDLETGGDHTASWQGNGFDLTKKGRGLASINQAGEMNVPNINIEEGTLLMQGSTTATGSTITVGTGTVAPDHDDYTGGATLAFYNNPSFTGDAPAGDAHNFNVVLNGGRLTSGVQGLLTEFTMSGPVTVLDTSGSAAPDSRIDAAADGAFIVAGVISGAGGVTFDSDTGIVELQANNTYTGNTAVEGDLNLTGTAQLSGTPQIDINGGTMDVTGRVDGTMTLNNQTLNVNDKGTFNGAIATTGSSMVSFSSFNAINGDVTISSGSQLSGEMDATGQTAGNIVGDVVIESGGTFEVGGGLGQAQVIPNAFQQNGAHTIGGHRYIAFEAEDFTVHNDIGTSIDWAVVADGSALGGNKIEATGTQDTSAGNDDTVQYDMVFTEPGTYYWYVRSQAPGGNQTDSFYGPSDDASTGNASVAPSNGLSRFGISDELVDAEGTTAISASWDWLRSDPNAASQGSFVGFEKIIVTQEDVDASRLFSLAFEPRQVGAQLDKMVLADTFDFTDIDDTLLDGATSLTSGLINIPAPTLSIVVDGDVDLLTGSTMEFDLGAIDDFSHLSITGSADLFGDILVNLGGYTPNINDTFSVLSALGGIDDTGLSITGDFSHAVIGTDLILTYLGSSLLDGDLNADGFVGIADLNIVLGVWNTNVTPGDLLAGDPSGDGFVGIADLNVVLGNWNAGTPPNSNTAIPEPASLVLLGLGGMALLRRKA